MPPFNGAERGGECFQFQLEKTAYSKPFCQRSDSLHLSQLCINQETENTAECACDDVVDIGTSAVAKGNPDNHLKNLKGKTHPKSNACNACSAVIGR